MVNNTINKKKISIVPILLDHLKRYPLLTVQDIYKLIYQAAMGPEHLITDKNMAYTKLLEESAKINKFTSIPLYEDIDPTDQLVRLNINSYKQRQGDIEKLFEVFYRTSQTFYSNVENVKIYFEQTIYTAKNDFMPFEPDELRTFFTLKESQNFPTVHHSDIYRRSYRPAYRLVLKKLLHSLS